MAEAQIHPPSPSRVAAARAAGLAPRPTLTGLAAGLALFALVQHGLLSGLWRQLGALLRDPLQAWARTDHALALELARSHAWSVARTLALIGLGTVGCVALGLVLVQGAVFLWPRRPRRTLRAARPALLPGALSALAACLVLVLSFADALWLEPSQLFVVLSRWLGRLSGLVLAVALVDAALARERFFRALWLTRREQRDEWREAYGAPELRAARAESRRDAARAGADP